VERLLSRRFILRIDDDLVCRNLSRECGEEWTIAKVKAWLVAGGFSRREDGSWTAAEQNLGQLDPAEVTWLETANRPVGDEADPTD
jgi:hypothetical protein